MSPAAGPNQSRPPKRQPSRPQSRPRRWAYGEVTLVDIVAAASRVAQKVGMAKVTMRAVGEELGLTSMSLYYYVPNKEALLDLVIDEACSDVVVPLADGASWDERLRVLLRNARQVFLRFPGLANLMQVRPLTAQAMRLGEAADQLLLEGGFVDDETRRYALSSLINYFFGALGWESTLPMRSRNQSVRRTASNSQRTMRTGEWRYRQTELSLDELFEYGLDMAITGLRHKAQIRAGGRRRGSLNGG